ncbi:iron uptake transporter deferrochelatase/peroxidase subunit [Nocardioides sp.]|uniref:iron uptake transporter deferrochelatase/peroxidase subunit n=1 Tax=Nocardioides sp. TaxID=35761 RepID=UPI002B84D252|nr:iron uptake transporter deferrochelatase/peroxidase subunit [Nocardioides sp.]HVX53566.1 iron uptake transporter deferrochelatase/peroxidase subunit [Nocardioides sp.]
MSGVSRRGLIGGLGTAAATAAVAAAAPALLRNGEGASAATPTAPTDTAYSFEGAHQAGILTPVQRCASYVAFDVTAADRAELVAMFRTLTEQSRFLMTGGTPPDHGLTATTADDGILGPSVPADGLTVTTSVGASLFDGRFGLGARRPQRLVRMPAFDDDALDRAWCDGDVLLQIGADNNDTVAHALRQIMRATRGALQPRWRMDGFQSPPRPSGTPRNLLGYKDGTANPSTSDEDLMDQLVWTHAGGGEPAWVEGGSYHVVRLIRMLVEFWDRVSVREQNNIFGRDKATGAPLTGSHEKDTPDYGDDGTGTPLIFGDAHIRRASNSGNPGGSRMLRRSFNYDRGVDANGNLDMGLIFTAFNQDLERQFATVQRRLAGESLVDYILPYGGGYFFALPGVSGSGDWLGRGMFA